MNKGIRRVVSWTSGGFVDCHTGSSESQSMMDCFYCGGKNEPKFFNSSAEIRLPYEPDGYYVFAKNATSPDSPFCRMLNALGDLMEESFFFNKSISFIAAGRCLLVFVLRCWSHDILLKKTKQKLWAAWIGAAFGAIALLLMPEVALARQLQFTEECSLFGSTVCMNRMLYKGLQAKIFSTDLEQPLAGACGSG